MDSAVLTKNRENIMNAQANQAKENLLTRARYSTLDAQEFASLLDGELAKIQSRSAPKSAGALERHEATIAGYKSAIAELTHHAPTETAAAAEQAIDAPIVAVMVGGEFAGVVSANSSIDKMASDSGLTDFSVIKSCGLCSVESEVPASAKVIYKAAWDEVIESDVGHTGRIVWSID